jgi:class 3 adenylate cyclase
VAINLMLAEKAAEGAPEITVGVGIDYGRFLMIPGEDCYGDPINISYKLGEDLARPGEVLITSAARERLPAGLPYALQEQPASVSGLELTSFSIQYDGKR